MPLRIQRRGLAPAAVVALLGTLLLYVGTTAGLAAWHRHDTRVPANSRGYLPTVIENAPASVPTTDTHGPSGPVAVVWAGTDVERGLTGSVSRPWLAVSAVDGGYRALSAPGLPEAADGAVRVSPDGGHLAWAADGEVHVHDTLDGGTRVHEVDGASGVGPFSPDGEHLLVLAGGAAVLGVADGEVVASSEAGPDAVRGAAWRPDGSAVDLVVDDRLLTLGTDGTSGGVATGIPPGGQLAWSPGGDRLADLRDVAGSFRLFVSELRADGSLAAARRVEVPGVSIQRLLGFSGEGTVAVDAYLLESGNVERVLDVSLARGSTTDLTTLPPPGSNWTGQGEWAVATDTLARGSYEWPTQVWPWSHRARLVASGLLMFFLFGLYVTRRPRTR